MENQDKTVVEVGAAFVKRVLSLPETENSPAMVSAIAELIKTLEYL